MRGEYVELKRLGRGRFAETWLVRHIKTGIQYALKRFSTWRLYREDIAELESLSGPEVAKANELFKREVAVLQQLEHPGIPKYVDSYNETVNGDPQHVLVQELIDGKTLAELLRDGPRFSEEEVIDIAARAAHVLEYLHGLSPPIIHRDLKPSNIMVRDDGSVVLIDFGAVFDAIAPEHGSSTIIGTFGYMPMEQYEGRPVPATDVYSLGVVLVELLTRKRPAEIERRRMEIQFRPHVRVRPSFADLLEDMLKADWHDRPADGAELQRRLSELKRMPAPKRKAPAPKKKKKKKAKKRVYQGPRPRCVFCKKSSGPPLYRRCRCGGHLDLSRNRKCGDCGWIYTFHRCTRLMCRQWSPIEIWLRDYA